MKHTADDRLFGTVLSVTERSAGGILDVAASATDTELTLDDVSQFGDEAGDALIRDEDGNEEAIVITEVLPAEGASDTDRLTLAAPLAGSWPAGVLVVAVPEIITRYAEISTHGAEDDTVEALVPSQVARYLSLGSREDANQERVSIEFERQTGNWVIHDVYVDDPDSTPIYVNYGDLEGLPTEVYVNVVDAAGASAQSYYADMANTTLHPIGRLWRTTNQSISFEAYSQIDFGASYSLGSQGITSSDANDRFTITVPAVFSEINADETPGRVFIELHLHLTFSPAVPTELQGYIVKNATTVAGNYIGHTVISEPAVLGAAPTLDVFAVDELGSVGDYYTFHATVLGDANVNILGGKHQVYAAARIISWQ